MSRNSKPNITSISTGMSYPSIANVHALTESPYITENDILPSCRTLTSQNVDDGILQLNLALIVDGIYFLFQTIGLRFRVLWQNSPTELVS